MNGKIHNPLVDVERDIPLFTEAGWKAVERAAKALPDDGGSLVVFLDIRQDGGVPASRIERLSVDERTAARKAVERTRRASEAHLAKKAPAPVADGSQLEGKSNHG